MAIYTADDFFAAARQGIFLQKATVTTVAQGPHSLLDVSGQPGAGSLAIGNTTTGLVPTDALAGCPAINAFGAGATGYLAAAAFRNTVNGSLVLYDRLWHAGSIAMTTLATTTFASQPSFASRLPGGTDLSMVEMLLEIAADVSATATTILVTYTNESGVTGRSTGTGSLSGYTARRVIQMPLQAGDKGVSKIESITIGGTVATTGSVNVVLARRLAQFDIRVANAMDSRGWDLLGAPEVFADSALWLVGRPDSTGSGNLSLDLSIVNG